MSLKALITKLPLLVALIAAGALGGVAHADSYNGSNLIDNSIFVNANTMSQNDIQTFLNGKGGALASQTFPTDSNGNQSAAWIIYYVSQHVGLNPQSIMATMQKEESLITDPSPSSPQYNFAMGYGCPDSSSCSDPGFWNQTIDGSWQLRFDYERAGGNTSYWTAPDGTQWGNPSITYPCATKPSISPWYYDTGLFAGSTVNFSDKINQIYATINLANRSTAALYCYTPHAYPGDANYPYSGSYNFVQSFIAWWGAVHTNVPPYGSAYAGQSAYPVLNPGASAMVSMLYSNTGSQTWYDDTDAAANHAQPVHLATADPVNRASVFGSSWGAGQNRPAGGTFSAVYNADGTTLAANQHIVASNQIAKFSFTVTAPANQPAGTYRELFQPIVEGGTTMNDPYTFMNVTVNPIYTDTFSTKSADPTLRPTDTTTAFISYQNTSNAPWYDDLSVFAAPGTQPVHLATSHAINRSSIFGSSWGGDQNRPASTFAAVYESDGTTLSPNQHVVQPGEIGKFAIPLTVPANQAAGAYQEYFQPIVEGGSTMNDPATSITVTVSSQPVAKYTASPSDSFSMVPGGVSTRTLSFVNTGNTSWTPGSVSLMATNPAATHFKSSFWSSPTIAAPLNESSVSPGATGTFTLSLGAPTIGGSYAATFSPASSGAAFGSPAATLTINVAAPVMTSAYAGQSAYPTLVQGQQTTGYLEYKNTGSIPWYDDTSLVNAPFGAQPTHLATSHGINRTSVLGSSWGGDQNRPDGGLFSTVYEADGVTVAPSQHIVQPGEIAKFNLVFTAGTTLAPGIYREFFQPIVEGGTTMNDPSTFLNVTVQAASYASAYAGQSAYPTVTRGGSMVNGFIEYTNSGNTPWYDDAGLSAAPAGTRPVHLATSHPINRTSSVGTTWGGDQNRPNGGLFSTVYEADGITLATNQHVVQPGQIAKFIIPFSASSTLNPGIYREFFQPIVEGGTTMNDPSTFLNVTVQ